MDRYTHTYRLNHKNLVTSMQVRLTVTADSMNCPLKKFVKYEMKTSRSVGRYTVKTVPTNRKEYW